MRTFPPYQRKQKEAQEQTARTIDKGHGRKEIRTLTSTTALNNYLDWPDVGQVFELERVRIVGNKTEVEVVYGLTSLGRDSSDVKELLGRIREHWGIENRLHYVRDETLGEDRCRVRKGNGTQVLAAIRNACVHLLEDVKARSKAAATRRLAAHPKEALVLLLQ
jgi:Transposase DDE domain